MLRICVITFFSMAIGAGAFIVGAFLMNLPTEPDGIRWVWNLACTALMLAGITVFFGPAVIALLEAEEGP